MSSSSPAASPSIGEQLKQTREGRNLTLKQAVQATRIRAHYLEALEADDLSAIPSSVQARGFLRSYAQYLGLNLDELVARQRGESPPAPIPPVEQPVDSAQAEAPPEPKPADPPAAPPDPETDPEPGPPSESQTIFIEIGQQLRLRRELLSLTLEEIERHTRIRRHHLEKIESGDLDSLPSPVQARGLLNAYAGFLDLDAEAILLRFADALQARRAERQPLPPQRKRKPASPLLLGLKRFINADLIFGGSMVLILLGMAIWGATRLLPGSRQNAETATAEGPSISEVLLATPVDAATATPPAISTSVSELGTAIPTDAPPELPPDTPAPLIEFAPASAVQLTLLVLERTYLKVIVDGEVQQDGRVVPGAALKFEADQRVEVLTGSGASLQVIYNQQNLGIMGSFGEVVNLIYTVNGVETPTPTPSPTPTVTPRRSPTPPPTNTPLATETALP